MIFKLIKVQHKVCLVSIVLFCFFHNDLYASKEPTIRVLISKNDKIRIRSDRFIPLTVEGNSFFNNKIKGLTIKNQNTRKILYFDKNKQKIINLKNKQKFQVRSSDGRGIWVGNKRYSGKINLYIVDSKIFVVNVIGIERYLSSVVGAEMPTKWPIEALKAQAIASRTYALKQKGTPLYDIDSTQKNQVYNGLESGTRKTRRAVKSTRSLVLIYKNKLINALFHSSSGGMTENSQDVWKNKFPYLSTVKDFDKNNPKLRWEKRLSNVELQNLFPNIGGINKIEILNISDTGRVKNVRIYGEYGSNKISGLDVRQKMNLNSTLFRFKLIEDEENNKFPFTKSLLVTGQGSGHGVGMSQWGAKYMASKGQKAETILKYYYKGVQVKPYQKSFF